MRGPRKVRVFRDPKKSPNWYVEWRDPEGRRRTESCGPARKDAEDRAQQLRQELRSARQASLVKRLDHIVGVDKIPVCSIVNMLRFRGQIDLGQSEVPIEISLEITDDLIQALRSALPDIRTPIGDATS
jgi:hypothetical protein